MGNSLPNVNGEPRDCEQKNDASVACKSIEQRDASRVDSDAWFGSFAVTLFDFQKDPRSSLASSFSPLRLRLQKPSRIQRKSANPKAYQYIKLTWPNV
jgi:hypothetical protein